MAGWRVASRKKKIRMVRFMQASIHQTTRALFRDYLDERKRVGPQFRHGITLPSNVFGCAQRSTTSTCGNPSVLRLNPCGRYFVATLLASPDLLTLCGRGKMSRVQFVESLTHEQARDLPTPKSLCRISQNQRMVRIHKDTRMIDCQTCTRITVIPSSCQHQTRAGT